MALALRLEKLLATGVVKDFRTLARLGHVSPARISQIMSLLHLAPDIQEALLFRRSVARIAWACGKCCRLRRSGIGTSSGGCGIEPAKHGLGRAG
jgi:hypothetical protein